jgi:hypothetical protein
MTPAGFPHSDTPGSTLGCQLPRAYRRLLRPSSALDAKASTMCPSQLVTHTTNPTPPPNNPIRHPTKGTPNRADQRSGPDWRCTHQATKEPHTHPHTDRSTDRPTTRAGMHTYIQTSNHTHHPAHPQGQTPQEKTNAFGAATRCSRPLSRSQTTTPHPNPCPTRQWHTGRRSSRVQLKPQHPHKPATPDKQAAGPAGLILQNPNSVPPPPDPALCSHC